MRRHLLFIGLGLITAVPVCAQTTTALAYAKPTNTTTAPAGRLPTFGMTPRFRPAAMSGIAMIGVRGGINYLAYIRNAPDGEFTRDLLGHGGLVFNTGGEGVSFQAEVIYNSIGAGSKGRIEVAPSTFADVMFKARGSELQIPLLANIKFGEPAATRFFVNLGPYAGYTLNARIKASASALGQQFEQESDETPEEFQDRFSYGAAAGLGVMIPAGPGNFTIEMRGLWPLGTLREFESSDAIILQGSVGYLIPFGGR